MKNKKVKHPAPSSRHSDVALLVVDMQYDFLSQGSVVGSEGKRKALPGVQRLVKCFREKGLPIFHIITLHKPNRSDWGILDKKLNRAYCIEGTRGAEIVDELEPEKGEYVKVKRRYSGFFNTGLEEELREMGVKILIICGESTECCVRATALDAYYRDYWVVIPEEAVSATDGDSHVESIKFFRKSIGRVISLDELITSIDRQTYSKLYEL